jgi:hypothetical protein
LEFHKSIKYFKVTLKEFLLTAWFRSWDSHRRRCTAVGQLTHPSRSVAPHYVTSAPTATELRPVSRLVAATRYDVISGSLQPSIGRRWRCRTADSCRSINHHTQRAPFAPLKYSVRTRCLSPVMSRRLNELLNQLRCVWSGDCTGPRRGGFRGELPSRFLNFLQQHVWSRLAPVLRVNRPVAAADCVPKDRDYKPTQENRKCRLLAFGASVAVGCPEGHPVELTLMRVQVPKFQNI